MIALGQFFTSGITLGITMFQLTLVNDLKKQHKQIDATLNVSIFKKCFFLTLSKTFLL